MWGVWEIPDELIGGSKMIVYHGTTEDRAEKILFDGYISITTNENKRHKTTNTGCVYVTKDFYQAIDFSTRPEKGLNCYPVVIFEIKIDERELVQDKDEEKWKSTLDANNGYKNCYIIKRNLIIGTDVTRKFYKYFGNSSSAGKYMQDVQFGRITINNNDKEWENLQ